MVWIGGKHYNEEEYEALSRKESEERMARHWAEAQARERERQEAAQLLRRLGAAYTEYKNFLEARPHLGPPAAGEPAGDLLFYEKLRQNLGHADEAPRCSHIKPDGLRCGSPRMKTGALCYAHQRMADARPRGLRLPTMEDANNIQLGLMEVARALVDRQISERSAGLLLYCLQTAANNVGHVTFHKTPAQMVVEETATPPGESERPAAEPGDGDRELTLYQRYRDMDPDLKLKLQEIGDEIDRRAREKCSRESASSPAAEADPDQKLTGANAHEEKLNQADADVEANPKLLTAAGTAERPAPPMLAARFETAFTALGDAAETAELGRIAESENGLSP